MEGKILVLDKGETDLDSIFEEMQRYNNAYHVDESDNLFEEDFDGFMSDVRGQGFDSNPNKDGFIVSSVNEFWSVMKDDVKTLLENYSFVQNKWEIVNRITMEYGHWVYYDGTVMTLSDFVDICEEGVEYKIYSFLDYLC